MAESRHPNFEDALDPDHATPRRSRRSARVRAACQRCQKRKIKCDGIMPCCGACKKAGTECVDSTKDVNGNSARVYIASLQQRVRWLEGILRNRCPDVDLENGPQITDWNASDLMSSSQGNEGVTTVSNDQGYISPIGTAASDSMAGLSRQGEDIGQGQPQPVSEEHPERIAHEIGLVSVSAGTDPRYIGPSSGYFFAKLVFSAASKNMRVPFSGKSHIASQDTLSLIKGLLQTTEAPLPPSMDHALRLSRTYFDTIHRQYPFLHQASHNKLVEHVYNSDEPDAVAVFQVNMVLAIGATILSRQLRINMPGEGYCASAMKHFDKICIENSVRGVQSLLLLLVYSMHSPSLGINAWYVNYQCLAAVLDLGLQRDIKPSANLSTLEQEMRTRIFWVIYTFDRTLATIMGRPIGLRDEACELRLPSDIRDDDLTSPEMKKRQHGEPCTEVTHAIHLFKLAKINSEIKYIANSVSKELPPYTYPRIPEISAWQNDVLSRLQTWLADIPENDGDENDMATICKIQYHGMVMALLRPTPAIANPTIASLKECYKSAVQSIRLYDKLYRSGKLIYTWTTIHSVFLATLTMLYCIRVVPEVAAQTKLDALLIDLKASSNILSATGEHWSESERSRELLDHIASAIVSWMVETQAAQRGNANTSSGNGMSLATQLDQTTQTGQSITGTWLPQSEDSVMVDTNGRVTDLDFFSSLADLRWSDGIDIGSNWNFDSFVQDFLSYDNNSWTQYEM